MDGATGVARGAADIILLESDLAVVADGVEQGRRTFANIVKYVRTGASSNFGDMLSMAAASLLLPFARVLQFSPPPAMALLALGGVVVVYLLSAEILKRGAIAPDHRKGHRGGRGSTARPLARRAAAHAAA